MTTNGLPYTYGQDFVVQTGKQIPSKVVNKHLKRKQLLNDQLTIFSFGYAMESNSTLGWYESITPLYLFEEKEMSRQFESEINRFINASKKIADVEKGYLVNAIKLAWFEYNYKVESKKNPRDKRKDPFEKILEKINFMINQ